MILGLSTYTFGWAVGTEGNRPDNSMDERDLIQAVLDSRLRSLQIGDNLPIHIFTEARLQGLKEKLKENAIRLEVGAAKLEDENLHRYILLCEKLNAPLLRFVIDGEGYEPDLRTAESIIRNALPELKRRNITLGIENHDRFKAKDLVALMEAINSPSVGICLDCVNSMGAGEGLEHVAGLLAPYTVNLHIKDFRVERLPHKMGFTIRGERAGSGMMNVGYLLELLSQYNRCQSAVLEQWVPPEDGMDATIKKEQAWAKESIAYLQRMSWFQNEAQLTKQF